MGHKRQEGNLAVVNINKPKLQVLRLTVVGITPLICANKSKSAVDEIVAKVTGGKSVVRKIGNVDPQKAFQDSLYLRNNGDYGFPTRGFKGAAVDVCSQLKSITKVQVRQLLDYVGEDTIQENGLPMNLVPLIGKPRPWFNLIPLPFGGLVPCWLAEFPKWEAKLEIRFNPDIISTETVINIIDASGRVGVGYGRSTKGKSGGSNNGQFRVKENV